MVNILNSHNSKIFRIMFLLVIILGLWFHVINVRIGIMGIAWGYPLKRGNKWKKIMKNTSAPNAERLVFDLK